MNKIGYILPVVSLMALGIMLGYVVSVSLGLYVGAEEDSDEQKAFLSLCVITFASLGITLLLMMWSLFRWIRLFKGPSGNLKPTEYIDAWSAAGKRIDAEDVNQDGQEDDSD